MGDDTVQITRWVRPNGEYGYQLTPNLSTSLMDDQVGVWRSVPADARRDRIVRAAEALELVWREAGGAFDLVRLNDAAEELRAAVAAMREAECHTSSAPPTAEESRHSAAGQDES